MVFTSDRSRKWSRKSGYNLVKIKNRSHKRNHKCDGILESEKSEHFHFFRLSLRLHRLRSAYDIVKTSLSESEAEGLTNHHYDITSISQVASKKVTFNTILIFCTWHLCILFLHCVILMARQLLYAYRISVRLIAVLQCGFTSVFETLVNWHVFVPLG